MNFDPLAVIAAFLFAVATLFMGAIALDSSWKDDCEKIGIHRTGDKVYECKLKVGA